MQGDREGPPSAAELDRKAAVHVQGDCEGPPLAAVLGQVTALG